jgi:predicted DNA-binding transcriptional regulator YafY
LVQHFQVNRKTIRKDIDALSRHHPITDERVGRHVMYRFIDGFRFQPRTHQAKHTQEAPMVLITQHSLLSPY